MRGMPQRSIRGIRRRFRFPMLGLIGLFGTIIWTSSESSSFGAGSSSFGGLASSFGATDVESDGRSSLFGSSFGLKVRKSYRPDDPSQRVVCLIHGMNSSSGGFVHLIPLLERAGLGVVVYDYPFDRDLDQSAPQFIRDWTAFRERNGDRRPWAVVTHSMGALLARDYVEGPDYAGDVSDLILIAPPNSGSHLARAQPLIQLLDRIQMKGGNQAEALAVDLGEAAEDLLPGSAFLQRLNARPRREGVSYHILAGDVGFLDRAARRRIEAQLGSVARTSGVLGGLARITGGSLLNGLDELCDGTGDGAVSVASTKLAGVGDHVVIPANHVYLIRGPLLYPEPGPVVCLPHILRWLKMEPRPSVTSDDPMGAPMKRSSAIEGSTGGDF